MYIESNCHAKPSFGTRIMLHEQIVAEVQSVTQAKKIRNYIEKSLHDGYDADLFIFPSNVKKTKKKEPLQVQGKIYLSESSCCGEYLKLEKKYPKTMKPFDALYEKVTDIYKKAVNRMKDKSKITEFEESISVFRPRKKLIKKKRISVADKIKLILDDFTVKKTVSG